jgi:hypothetical protein
MILKFPTPQRPFLSEDVVPNTELERRTTIRETIKFLQSEVAKRTQQDAVGLAVAINRLKLELPPCLEMDVHWHLRPQPCGGS